MPSCRLRSTLVVLLLLGMTFVAYIPVTWAGYVWDDDDLVTHNLNIRSLSGLWTTWFDPANGGRFYPDYYPLTYTTWAIEYRLWGLDPLGYHLNNVLLHGLNAVLVWVLLRRLRVPGALLAAAVFAVHPVHVESVAWVSERKNVLSGMFYLLTAWAFLAAFDPRPDEAAVKFGCPGDSSAAMRSGRAGFLGLLSLSLLLYALAMLAKPVSMTLAGVLPLLLWWRRGRLGWREILPAAPYLLLSLPMAVLTTWFQHHHVRVAGRELTFTLVERTLIAGRVLAFYAWSLIWPTNLSFAYPSWKIDSGAAWQYLFPVGVMAALLALWLGRRRLGVGPIIGVLFFCVNLSPALGYIDILWHRYYFVADHVQYLASLGLTAVVCAVAAQLFGAADPGGAEASVGAPMREPVAKGPSRIVPSESPPAPAADPAAAWLSRLAGAALLALLSMLTFNQAAAYESKLTLWSDVLEKDPRSWVAMINLGSAHAIAGQLDVAAGFFDRALAINPGAYEAHYNLGAVDERLGRHEEAIAHFEQAVKLKPHFPAALNALAKADAARGEIARAERRFRMALEYNPHLSDAHLNYGLLLARTGRGEEALRRFELALRHQPDLAEAHAAAATELQSKGDPAGAERHYRRAIALSPDYLQAINNLAVLLAQRGDHLGAIDLYRRALALRPDYLTSRTNLAGLLEATGRRDEAIFHLREAARLRPDDPGIARALQGALDRALAPPAPATAGSAGLQNPSSN